MIARMWEARAEPESFDALLRWVCDVALPELERAPGHLSAEVFRAANERIVVISRWRGEPTALPDPPSHLMPRPPHAWDFTPVTR